MFPNDNQTPPRHSRGPNLPFLTISPAFAQLKGTFSAGAPQFSGTLQAGTATTITQTYSYTFTNTGSSVVTVTFASTFNVTSGSTTTPVQGQIPGSININPGGTLTGTVTGSAPYTPATGGSATVTGTGTASSHGSIPGYNDAESSGTTYVIIDDRPRAPISDPARPR